MCKNKVEQEAGAADLHHSNTIRQQRKVSSWDPMTMEKGAIFPQYVKIEAKRMQIILFIVFITVGRSKMEFSQRSRCKLLHRADYRSLCTNAAIEMISNVHIVHQVQHAHKLAGTNFNHHSLCSAWFSKSGP